MRPGAKGRGRGAYSLGSTSGGRGGRGRGRGRGARGGRRGARGGRGGGRAGGGGRIPRGTSSASLQSMGGGGAGGAAAAGRRLGALGDVAEGDEEGGDEEEASVMDTGQGAGNGAFLCARVGLFASVWAHRHGQLARLLGVPDVSQRALRLAPLPQPWLRRLALQRAERGRSAAATCVCGVVGARVLWGAEDDNEDDEEVDMMEREEAVMEEEEDLGNNIEVCP